MDKLTAIRQYLHQHPEVSQDEYETQKYLLNLLKKSIEDILNNGIQHNQINPTIDVKNSAIIMIASLEGAIMMSKLNNSTTELQVITAYLKSYMLHYKI